MKKQKLKEAHKQTPCLPTKSRRPELRPSSTPSWSWYLNMSMRSDWVVKPISPEHVRSDLERERKFANEIRPQAFRSWRVEGCLALFYSWPTPQGAQGQHVHQSLKMNHLHRFSRGLRGAEEEAPGRTSFCFFSSFLNFYWTVKGESFGLHDSKFICLFVCFWAHSLILKWSL